MKIGLQFEIQPVPGVDDNLVISETMDQSVFADEVGFDYLWFVEHHFLTGFALSSSPEVLIGALSQRTSQIRLGFGVVILPYHHPIRVAERIALLDHLSQGRIDFGTGRSSPYELTGMGIDPADSRAMWEESVTMIPKIWESDWFSWEGRFWPVPSRQVRPKPLQNPHPPIWLAALQNSTYDIAAEKGIGVMAFGCNAPENLEPYVRAYKEKVRHSNPVGGTINGQWLNNSLGICLEDNREARELGRQSVQTFFGPDKPYVKAQKDVYEQLVEKWGGVPEHLRQNFSRYVELPDADERAAEDAVDLTGGGAIGQKMWESMDADTLCDRGVIIAGDPDSCIEALKKHEAIGVDQVSIMMQTETIPHDKIMKSIELFGKYVIPEFKES